MSQIEQLSWRKVAIYALESQKLAKNRLIGVKKDVDNFHRAKNTNFVKARNPYSVFWTRNFFFETEGLRL